MKDNVLYVKCFENGEFYIGITDNFKRRMYEHNKKKSYLYNKINSMCHATLVLGIYNNRIDAILAERWAISNFTNMGFNMLNRTEGGEGEYSALNYLKNYKIVPLNDDVSVTSKLIYLKSFLVHNKDNINKILVDVAVDSIGISKCEFYSLGRNIFENIGIEVCSLCLYDYDYIDFIRLIDDTINELKIYPIVYMPNLKIKK